MLSKRYESTEVDRRTWLHVPSGTPPWGRRGRIRPQHPLACRKRRLNGAACLPWAATRVA